MITDSVLTQGQLFNQHASKSMNLSLPQLAFLCKWTFLHFKCKKTDWIGSMSAFSKWPERGGGHFRKEHPDFSYFPISRGPIQHLTNESIDEHWTG